MNMSDPPHGTLTKQDTRTSCTLDAEDRSVAIEAAQDLVALFEAIQSLRSKPSHVNTVAQLSGMGQRKAKDILAVLLSA